MESALRKGAGAPGLKLIETLRLGGGRMALHAARMERGAAALGWRFSAEDFAAAVGGLVPDAGLRVRVTLDAAGRIEVAQAALPAGPALWRVGLARARLASGDPWLAVKSTRRETYDRARAGMSDGLHELLLSNERGEVCDGTITTVFFDRGLGMRTPPLASGLLPGVLRAEIACPEEVLLLRDLPRVQLWVGNSLRGLLAAEFVTGGQPPVTLDI